MDLKIKLSRKAEPKKVDYLTIVIGDDRYRIYESNGTLHINKHSYSLSSEGTDDIRIRPIVSNQIEIS